MKCGKETMLLYAVTDRSWLMGRTLYEDVEAALKGGATCIQLREKDLDEESFLKEACELNVLCRQYKVPFIINDNVEIAIACGAHGVHVGQHDMEAGKVRSRIGPDKILGVSVQTEEQARRAEAQGADYLGVGAVFSTDTKKDADNVAYETLRAICSAVSVPVVAIGGIHAGNVMELSGSGVDGIAVVSALFASEHIEKAAEELLILSERMVAE